MPPTFTRSADPTTQGHEAAHGGDGWRPRETAHRDELGSVWRACGVNAECGTLRAVLMRRPGHEIEGIANPADALWLDVIDPVRAREQHDALVALYRSHGVTVDLIDEGPVDKPNLYFCRDLFGMSPAGAIVARLASAQRAGEERQAAAALGRLGIPILHTVSGAATFEGGDLIIVNSDLAFVGEGIRTNPDGAAQVARVLAEQGIAETEVIPLNYGCGHIDGVLSIVDRDLALVYPTQLVYRAVKNLRRHGFRIIDVPDAWEANVGMATNMVALAPGVVVMPAGNAQTRAVLERHGVTCIEIDVSELMNGGGSLHCMTGVLQRERV